MTEVDVLVIGAGPSGMVAAAELARRGITTVIADRRRGPTERSKATILWPRAIDVIAEIDGADEIRDTCLAQESLRYHDGGRGVATLTLPQNLRPAVAPQNVVEAILATKLETLSCGVRWHTEVSGLTPASEGVHFTLNDLDNDVATEGFAKYVIAADGAWSATRDIVGAGFSGVMHEMTFVVADAELHGPNLHERSTYYWCSPRGIVVMTRLDKGVWRVFTTLPPGKSDSDVTVELVQELLRERVPLAMSVGEPEWISPFRVHARQIDSMRHGRVLFVGDAAHIHSPAGGQGVNLGILDAHNAAWKLALVVQGKCTDALLDSFALERGRAAAAAVRQADLQTRFWMIRGRLQRQLRNAVLQVVSATKLYMTWYGPWLTGYRTMYSRWADSPHSVSALLHPEKKHLLGESVGYRSTVTGTLERRVWTSPGKFVLLRRDGGGLVTLGSHRHVIEAKNVPDDQWARLAGRDRHARKARFMLVAPDGYIWGSGKGQRAANACMARISALTPTRASTPNTAYVDSPS